MACQTDGAALELTEESWQVEVWMHVYACTCCVRLRMPCVFVCLSLLAMCFRQFLRFVLTRDLCLPLSVPCLSLNLSPGHCVFLSARPHALHAPRPKNLSLMRLRRSFPVS